MMFRQQQRNLKTSRLLQAPLQAPELLHQAETPQQMETLQQAELPLGNNPNINFGYIRLHRLGSAIFLYICNNKGYFL